MYQVETTKDFDAWLDGLKDSLTRKRLGMRLRKAQPGNMGGGDKSTQTVDIAASVPLAHLFKA
jgi:putative component of toxin-antitoxin plasmid stabilization module